MAGKDESQLTICDDGQADPRLLDALASLNQIGAAVNRISPRDIGSVEATLRLIVESAIEVVPGTSAVIYTYDRDARAFDLDSRLSAGEPGDYVPSDEPRAGGLGMRAIGQRRRVLSYEEEDVDIHPDKVQAGAKAMACYPLIVADHPVGILYVYLHQDRCFGQLELLMLDNFVNQAAMAIYQARRLASVQRDLARREDELSRLRHAGLLISSRLRLEETLEAILQMALEVTDAQYGIFRLVDGSGESLVARAVTGGAVAGKDVAHPMVEILPIDSSSIMGWVAEHREPLCIHDLNAAPWVRIYQPLYADLRMQSELAVPLVGASGRLEGVLNLESPAVGAFNEQDSLLLQSLATQAVVAIQEARLLDALLEVAQLLLAQPCEQVLGRLVDLACELLNGAASAIWTLEGDELVLQVASTGYQRGERLPLGSSLAGQAIIERRPVRADDMRTDPRFNRPDLAREQDWSRALIVPLLTNGERLPVGVFSVYSVGSEPGRFAESEWDEKVLTCLAHYAALAVQNETRQKELRAVQKQHAVAETFAVVGDIAANVLHHLNNKVGTIPVRIQGIQDKSRGALLADPYLAKNLEEIEHSACAALESVRENLAHLRPIHPAPVDVAAFALAAVDAATLPEGVHVEIKGLADLPPVIAGKQSLTLVFGNLLENAAEAMGGEGTVVIEGAAGDEWVEIAVGDDGPGIPPELQDAIFEFDFSGHRSSRPSIGFGLWWVKTLMARLGGSVAVESDGVHGTTFRLRLPRVQEGA
ncbi:MAG: GAF domain-containing protein [Anaerolineae bacterium]|nr:GAF domain-containing protein [Anaerolineae bacterium]